MEIYIHIPFCVQKCKYCDFLSAPADKNAKDAYMEALCSELKGRSQDYGQVEVTSIFIGGGTPTAVDAAWIVKIMDILYSEYQVNRDAEITMEMNPATVTSESLRTYKKAGINRLSIGLQSANSEELQRIGRIHDYEEFENNYFLARDAGFDNINVDIMSALPGQTFKSYCETLEKIVSLNPAPEHISAYSLILEEGTPLYREYECGALELPDEETDRKMYEFTGTFLQSKGYERYEISNYSLKGKECRHNIGYWVREDYLGFGIGAASKIGNRRFSNTSDITKYEENPCNSYEDLQILSKEEEMEEIMFLGLRLIAGVSMNSFEQLFGISMEQVYGKVLEQHMQSGLLYKHKSGDDYFVRLTSKGLDVCNYVMADFLEPGLF